MDGFKTLSLLTLDHAYRLGPVVGPDRANQLASVIASAVANHGELSTFEELVALVGDSEEAEALLLWAEEWEQDKLDRKRSKRIASIRAKSEMKVRYLPTATLLWFETDGRRKWRFIRDHRGQGLMQAVIEHIYRQPGMEPCAIPLLSQIPKEDAAEDSGEFTKISDEEIARFNRLGFVISQGKWVWNTRSPGWEILKGCFPNVVDATAYNHGLLAPTIPDGILLDQEIRLKTITTVVGGHEVPAECDGSGRVHPSLMPYTSQIRFLNLQGVFCKGIVVPDERCVRWVPILTEEWEPLMSLTPEEFEAAMGALSRSKGAVEWQQVESDEGTTYEFAYPEIWIDWLQVKGKWKGIAKERARQSREVVMKGHLGIIQQWSRAGEIDWCFELLECFQDTAGARKLMERFVDEAFDKLLEKGVDGLAAKVAKDSPSAALAVEFITMLRTHGRNYSPLTIPWLKEAVESKLGRILWHIGQGAGKTSARYVVCIDAGVPKGHVVLGGRGFRVGTEVALFRFPVVLSQVLTTCVVAEPLPHHLVDGKIPKWTIYMNPHDITSRMMGDDDGDTVGVSADPELVELFRNSIDSNVYLIEPDGVPINIPTGSPEANNYMSHDQRGDVGRLTILRAQLLACGDITAANSISILIQEAIDKAKRVPKWTDWRFAVYLDNWVADDEGCLRFKPETQTEYTDVNGRRVNIRNTIRVEKGHVDMKQVYRWCYDRLIAAGVPYDESIEPYGLKKTPAFTCGWRGLVKSQGKRIDPNKWLGSADLQRTKNGLTWEGGNLVHYSWDYAKSRWESLRAGLMLGYEDAQLANLVHELLGFKGVNIPIPDLTWKEYAEGLRKHSGVQQLGQAFKSARTIKDDEARYARFDDALEAFHARIQDSSKFSVADLATIWHMECKYARTVDAELMGNINYAYYAVSWEGSPIMTLLGKEADDRCRFLDQVKAEPIILRDCLGAENPLLRLGEILGASHLHAKHVRDESGVPVQGWECRDCVDRLQSLIVRKIRTDRKRKEHQFMLDLIAQLNG